MKGNRDWLNTETIKRPPTIVVFPQKNSDKEFLFDLKYADFTGIQDVPNRYPKAECYIIPPYKPLMYVALCSPNTTTNVYALRGKPHQKGEERCIKCQPQSIAPLFHTHHSLFSYTDASHRVR